MVRIVPVARLLPGLGSGVEELNIATVLPIAMPPDVEHITVAVMVMRAVAPGASESNVTVRLLPDPLQTPPPVEVHVKKPRLDGRVSDTVTDVAAFGPMLLTRIVLTISEPV